MRPRAAAASQTAHPARRGGARHAGARRAHADRGRNPFDGATVVNLSPAVADELGLDPFAGDGVLVTSVGRGLGA